jgi:hypothetical protein
LTELYPYDTSITATEQDPVAEAAITAWKKSNSPLSKPVSFTSADTKWWAQVDPFQYGRSAASLCLVIPETHLVSKVKTPLLKIFYSMLALLVILVLLLIVLLQKQIHFIRTSLIYTGHTRDTADTLLQIIQAGEDDKLEFKSTLRWNIKADKPGKEIELSCLKTIVAFLNTNGGSLLVGLEDDGTILGLNADRFPNDDKFLLHFNNLIKQHIGLEQTKFISFAITNIDDKSIFVVDCKKADTPVFLKHKDEEDFYVRLGPGSRKLSTSAAMQYLASGKIQTTENTQT